MKILAVSDSAYRPDIFRTSFLAVEGNYSMPLHNNVGMNEEQINNSNYFFIPIIIIALGLGIAYKKFKNKKTSKELGIN